jgi:hypothetical protein
MGNKCTKNKKYDAQQQKSLGPVKESPRVVHNGAILGLASSKEKIYSCSDDKRIAVSHWNHNSFGSCEKDVVYLDGHTKAVNRIILCRSSTVEKSRFWSVSRDLSIRYVSFD